MKKKGGKVIISKKKTKSLKKASSLKKQAPKARKSIAYKKSKKDSRKSLGFIKKRVSKEIVNKKKHILKKKAPAKAQKVKVQRHIDAKKVKGKSTPKKQLQAPIQETIVYEVEEKKGSPKQIVVVVSGTPCSGKTTLSKLLEKELGFSHLDVNKIIKENSLSEGYDYERKCDIIDKDKLKEALITVIKSSNHPLIIDSHMSHYLPKEYVDLCIVTKCNLKELNDRLYHRGYHSEKIRENLDAEIFDVCLFEALEHGHDIYVIYTDREIDLGKIKDKLKIHHKK